MFESLARTHVLKYPCRHFTGVYQHRRTEAKVKAELDKLYGAQEGGGEWETIVVHKNDVLYSMQWNHTSGQSITNYSNQNGATSGFEICLFAIFMRSVLGEKHVSNPA